MNVIWVALGDALEQGALLDAVAPDAGDDQDVDVAGEAGHELFLRVGQFRGVVNLLPAALLLVSPGLDVIAVRKGGAELVGKVSCVH